MKYHFLHGEHRVCDVSLALLRLMFALSLLYLGISILHHFPVLVFSVPGVHAYLLVNDFKAHQLYDIFFYYFFPIFLKLMGLIVSHLSSSRNLTVSWYFFCLHFELPVLSNRYLFRVISRHTTALMERSTFSFPPSNADQIFFFGWCFHQLLFSFFRYTNL